MTRRRDPRAFAVVDLGFGDAGKGLVTDYLVRRSGAELVVRFNGGAQAGHRVVAPDGRAHVFSQVGAGAFSPGARTLLAHPVVVHPTALLREADVLRAAGVADALERTAISERCRIITPFHQAAGRLRELSRGAGRHGSCGVGLGEAVRDAGDHPEDAVRAGDLRDPTSLLRAVERVRERLRGAAGDALPDSEAATRERSVFESPGLAERWCGEARRVAPRVVSDEVASREIGRARAVVFEGAQGLLLDERHGFHPHTTWSDCTPAAAQRLLAEAAPGERLELWGVLRAHGIRHGPGPFPSETADLGAVADDHNATNDWQGPVRYGWFDAVTARYALALTPGLDALVLTHLDALSRRDDWRLCDAYDRPPSKGAPGGVVRDVPASASPTLETQQALGRLLSLCTARLERVPADERGHLDALEHRIDRRVDFVSRGPSAKDVSMRP